MKKNILFWLITTTICLSVFSSCKESVTDIELNKTELTLIPGETETLIAIINPVDATNQEVTWTSSDTKIATVDDNGLITAINNGEATITVTTQDGNKKAKCEITVDYLSQWVGDWDFVTIKFDKLGWGIVAKETVYYTGKIYHGNVDNFGIDPTMRCTIKYTEDEEVSAWVDLDGKIYTKYITGAHQTGGYFKEKNKVYLYFAYGETYAKEDSGWRSIDGIKNDTKGGKNE